MISSLREFSKCLGKLGDLIKLPSVSQQQQDRRFSAWCSATQLRGESRERPQHRDPFGTMSFIGCFGTKQKQQ